MKKGLPREADLFILPLYGFHPNLTCVPIPFNGAFAGLGFGICLRYEFVISSSSPYETQVLLFTFNLCPVSLLYPGKGRQNVSLPGLLLQFECERVCAQPQPASCAQLGTD